MGPKKKTIATQKKGKDQDKAKEEPKKPDAEKEPLPDYDWLPKKRKPKPEVEKPPEPVDDGLWLWPGDRDEQPIHSETFWSTGQPPKEILFGQKVRKKRKETDPKWCYLKDGDGPFIMSRPPSVCAEHGRVGSTPEQDDPDDAWCHEACDLVDRLKIADCDVHSHVKTPIFLQVDVVEAINRWDIRKTEVEVACAEGFQTLRWLGFAACTRMAFIKEKPPSKFVPLAVKTAKGFVLDVDLRIREVFQDGSRCIVEISCGPVAYTERWDGRPPSPTPEEFIKGYFATQPDLPILVDTPPPKPPPPKKKKKKKGEVEAPPPPPPVDPDNPDAPPPPQFVEVEVQTPTDIVTFIDWAAYDIPELMVKFKGDTDDEQFDIEWMVAMEMLTSYSGAIEAMIIWFGGQGDELEDIDFRWLNMEQFQTLFRDLKLSPVPFTANILLIYFKKYAEVNNVTGAYQISSWGFFPILLHLYNHSGLYEKFGPYYQPDFPVPFHEKDWTSFRAGQQIPLHASSFQTYFLPCFLLCFTWLGNVLLRMNVIYALQSSELQIWHFITVILLPNFASLIRPKLEDLHSAETMDSLAAIKEREEAAHATVLIVNPEYVEPKPEGEIDPNLPAPGLPDLSTPETRAAAIEAAILKHEQDEEAMKSVNKNDAPIVFANVWTKVDMEVDLKTIMPHFKKWRALGDNWDDSLAAAITIYALQKPLDAMEFIPKQYGLRFGYEEIQRFLLAASHCLYGQQCKPLLRVSEHSFLRTYLQDVFVRAKVAKPLYTTYKEKLEYMRLNCFRQEEPLPPLTEKKKEQQKGKAPAKRAPKAK